IHPRYQQWVTRNLRLLARNGYLQEQHGSFKREKPLPGRLLDEWQVVYQQAAARLTDPTLLAAGWHKRFPLMPAQSMENLKSVLTEELHSAEIYLSSEIREAYRIFHTSNTMLQILMQEVVALTKEDETLHILEIGAGFGTATAYLLPILPSSRTAYSYTDISTYFLQEAQEKFAAYPFVTYQLLDIEKNPQAQGYEMQHFDVIIAASVLHATANIAQSLGHVRSLLKPHGLLLLLEETKFHPIFDLTMGLQQGFDRFADTELRQAHPLLTRDMWYEVLTQQGFSSAAILNKAGTLNEFFGFDIVLAQGPTTVAPLSLTELYEHLRSKLPAYMLPLSIIPLETLPLTANGKVDRQALPHPLLQSQKPASSTRAARTPLAKRLVEMCRKLLNIRHVGVEDNFLQLGGDSLLAIKLLTQVQTAFGVEVPARIMFKKPTLEALAEVIEQYTTALMSASVSPPGLGHGLEVSLPQVVPAPSQMYQLFPITETQQAYWIGRNTVFELGNVGNHCYVEVEALEWNMARALLVLERLIQRHAMLRAVILPKGEQQILEQVPPSCIEYIDLQRLHQQHQDEQLLHIRREIDHHVYQVERWPAFVVRVSHLHEKRVRIHVSVEAVFADAWSMFLLVQEFVHLYHEPEASLPPLELSFRDYVLAKAQLQASELYERSRDYWLARIPTLPAAPDLPRTSDTASLSRPRFVPRNGRMEAAQWQRLKARGAQAGLTPSGILLAAFAEVLVVWSKTPHFCINLTLFNRLPLHEQVNEIVGDFTSLLILEIDNAATDLFEQRARRLQERLWQDADHRLYSGVHVLRDLARQHGSATQALMPVVFTSVLGQQTALTHPTPWQEIVYFVTQTPQVWLDHQVMEQVGHLVFYWHVVEELFPAGLIDDMFADYTQLLDRLAMDEAAWQSHSRELNSTSQPTQHTAANGQVSCYRPRHATLLLQEPGSGARVAQTPTEKTLSHLWCEMLNLSIVTVEENFLQLGGDSLLAIKLLARVQATCNVEVSLQAFFKNPTISAPAKVIELYQVNQRGEDQSCEDVQVLSGSASSLEEEGIV
ncbi:MAG: methyltransferase, partial [Chloroflexi bacterium]